MGEKSGATGGGEGVGFSDLQRARLHALGLQPMVRRAVFQPAAAMHDPHAGRPIAPAAAALDPEDGPDGRASSIRAESVAVRLCIAGGGSAPSGGPEARLLGDLLASLGLTLAQVRWASDDVLPEDVPVLAFGPHAPRGALRVAALTRLREPLEKRIAWPLLRQLRRQLRETAR